jgi:WD40 repeat protein
VATGAVHPITHVDGHADTLAASATGTHIIAAANNGALTVIDLSSQIVTTYRGHHFRLTAIAPPTPEFPYIASADVGGAVRVWPVPGRLARVAAEVHTRFTDAFYSRALRSVVATTFADRLTLLSQSEQLVSPGPHLGGNTFLASTADGSKFAAYGPGETIELWTASDPSRPQLLDTHHGSVSYLAFTRDGNELITAGRDGRLVRWAADGTPRTIATFTMPITMFAVLPITNVVVAAMSDGSLWRIEGGGRSSRLRAGGVAVTRMVATSDAQTVCVGYANGDVFMVQRAGQTAALILHAGEAIRDLVFSADGTTVAIAVNDGTIRIGTRDAPSWQAPGVEWVRFAASARKIAMTPDNMLIAICTNSAAWMYATTQKTWLFVPLGSADLRLVTAASDGTTAAILDADGHIILLDLGSARNLLDHARTSNRSSHP